MKRRGRGGEERVKALYHSYSCTCTFAFLKNGFFNSSVADGLIMEGYP